MKIKVVPKSTLAIPAFQIDQSEKIDITANGGLFLLAELVKQMKMIEGFARLGLYNRQAIGEAVHILALVINQFAGGDAIADTQYLDRDGALQAIFGDLHIPAAQTSGDFFATFYRRNHRQAPPNYLENASPIFEKAVQTV